MDNRDRVLMSEWVRFVAADVVGDAFGVVDVEGDDDAGEGEGVDDRGGDRMDDLLALVGGVLDVIDLHSLG